MSQLKRLSLLTLILILAAAVPSFAQDSCVDSGMKKIHRLGSSAVSNGPIESRQSMSDFLAGIRPEIEAIMERKGVSDLTDDLFMALSSGKGVSETQLERGDVLQWMIFRQSGKVAVGRGPYCLDSSESYRALKVDLVVNEEDLGSSIRTTTTTFVIPTICANLALVGTETSTAAKPAPPPPPPAPPKPVAPPPPPPVAPPPPPPEPEAMEPVEEPWDSRWTVRGFFARFDVDNDEFATDDGTERTQFTLANGNGFGANVEYRPSERIGVEGGLMLGSLDSLLIFDSETEWLMAENDLDFMALTVGPNFHLTPQKKFDFYIGLLVGLVTLDDTEFDLEGNLVRIDFDDEFAFGAQIGLDIPFGSSKWGAHLGGVYLDVDASGPAATVGLDPLIGTIGLAYNF